MLCAVSALALAARADDDIPSESQCRPYIEKALKELESGDVEPESSEKNESSDVSIGDDTKEETSAEEADADDSKEVESKEAEEDVPSVEVADEPYVSQVSYEETGEVAGEESKENLSTEDSVEIQPHAEGNSKENDDGDSKEKAEEHVIENESDEVTDAVESIDSEDSKEEAPESKEDEASKEDEQEENQSDEDTSVAAKSDEDKEQDVSEEAAESDDKSKEDDASKEADEAKDESNEDKIDDYGSQEKAESAEVKKGGDQDDSQEEKEIESKEEQQDIEIDEKSNEVEDKSAQVDDSSESAQDEKSEESSPIEQSTEEADEPAEYKDNLENEEEESKSDEDEKEEAKSDEDEKEEGKSDEEDVKGEEKSAEAQSDEESAEEGAPEEDLLLTGEIPENLRSREHIIQILRLDEEASESELIIEKSADIVLRDLKRLYENSIKPLEGLYKYRDLSNRHFGDPEIFSKPLVLFMGPWSGGKSSILNYLTGIEFSEWSLRTGAEPSPAYFNILMHGKEPEVLDGTQLAADWTFSGLQKFGQGLEERLRGLKYPSKLLEKVNIVEIPGILEVRKQVSRVFPFNDACQWFIDRADIIFLVYDPSKLDVGPETEAILDQLKGRESQTRIVLNKADTVKPEELMRVQSALIWNISPLMSSAQPPVMYTVSLWSMPLEAGAPARLLQAQERELFRDLRQAIDKRIENKIASARRFAVRVRNHAKMVDCYLTTYYNHKTIFGNRKLIADAIIDSPQNYHIYEGLSTLTNISRYDLPDPETYRDFFRLNPLYEFQQLSATCTYFRGCPITRLDVAIAYDFPELVGKYKKMVETATPQGMPKS